GTREPPRPRAARRSATSSALAVRIRDDWARTAAAMAPRARFFWSVGASASARAAARARWPISRITAAISTDTSILLSGALIPTKTRENPCPRGISYHVRYRPARSAGPAHGRFDPGGNVDRWRWPATG